MTTTKTLSNRLDQAVDLMRSNESTTNRTLAIVAIVTSLIAIAYAVMPGKLAAEASVQTRILGAVANIATALSATLAVSVAQSGRHETLTRLAIATTFVAVVSVLVMDAWFVLHMVGIA